MILWGIRKETAILTAVARVLLELFERKNVSRLGGDEFLVLLPDRNEEES